ncbi:hypothetical protein VIM7927_04471 [Vibrio mangrovi]|uniref:Uncharacterized protein n=1 Tax=Vibrio mangrovi TaxID=474394 RepID=A0A1Y6J1H2_9VIBR|nr:hypothetical protein VIM7927_04471 [Vibrio mangrovi]
MRQTAEMGLNGGKVSFTADHNAPVIARFGCNPVKKRMLRRDLSDIRHHFTPLGIRCAEPDALSILAAVHIKPALRIAVTGLV